MSVRRDHRTGRWYFRRSIKHADGSTIRLFGVPGIGDYADLSNTKAGADQAEQRAIARAQGRAIDAPKRKETPKPETPTVATYSETFLAGQAASNKPSSRRDKVHRLKRYILPALGEIRLDELRQEHVDRFTADLLKCKLSRKTVNNVLTVLATLVRYASANGVIASTRLRCHIRAQQPEMVAVSVDDVDTIAGAADPLYRAAILLGADAGLRVGEIRALTWAHVNELTREITVAQSLDERTTEIVETKGRKRRAVPISDRLWAALRALDRTGPWVIGRSDGSPLSYGEMRETIRAIYTAVKVVIPPKPWHGLRHSFCTTLADRGVPIPVIRELAGHESIETTLRYMHTGRDAKREAIAALRGSGVAARGTEKSEPASQVAGSVSSGGAHYTMGHVYSFTVSGRPCRLVLLIGTAVAGRLCR